VIQQKSHSWTQGRWFVSVFCFIVTALALSAVFRVVDGRILREALAKQDGASIVSAAVFCLLQVALGGERWRQMLSVLTARQAPPALSVQLIFYSSSFFNTLPLGNIGGDIARISLARKFKLPARPLITSVVVDHVVAVMGFIMLAVLTSPTVPHPFARVAWRGGVIALGGAAIGILLLMAGDRVLVRYRNHFLMSTLSRITTELRCLMQRQSLFALLYAVLSATCSGLAAYFIAHGLGIGMQVMPMLAIMSTVTLVVVLPISLAGWGLREVSLVGLLGLLGVNKEAAVLLSVEFGLLNTLVTLPGGAIWLMVRRKRQTPNGDSEEHRSVASETIEVI